MNPNIEITPEMTALVPVVVMIMQMLKGIPLYTKIEGYTPIFAILVGVGIAYVMSIPNFVVAGILIGVTASAGYDTFKKQIEAKNPTPEQETK